MSVQALNIGRADDAFVTKKNSVEVKFYDETWLEVNFPQTSIPAAISDVMYIASDHAQVIIKGEIEAWKLASNQDLSSAVTIVFYIGTVLPSLEIRVRRVVIETNKWIILRILPFILANLASDFLLGSDRFNTAVADYVGNGIQSIVFKQNTEGFWSYVCVDEPTVPLQNVYDKMKVTISDLEPTTTEARLHMQEFGLDDVTYATKSCIVFSPFYEINSGMTRNIESKGAALLGSQCKNFGVPDWCGFNRTGGTSAPDPKDQNTPDPSMPDGIIYRPTDVGYANFYTTYANLGRKSCDIIWSQCKPTARSHQILQVYNPTNAADIDLTNGIQPLFMNTIGCTVVEPDFRNITVITESQPPSKYQPYRSTGVNSTNNQCIPPRSSESVTNPVITQTGICPINMKEYTAYFGGEYSNGKSLAGRVSTIQEQIPWTLAEGIVGQPFLGTLSYLNPLNKLVSEKFGSLEYFTGCTPLTFYEDTIYAPLSPWRNQIDMANWKDLYNNHPDGYKSSMVMQTMVNEFRSSYIYEDAFSKNSQCPTPAQFQANAAIQKTAKYGAAPYYARYMKNLQGVVEAGSDNLQSFPYLAFTSTGYDYNPEQTQNVIIAEVPRDYFSFYTWYVNRRQTDLSLSTGITAFKTARIVRPFVSFFTTWKQGSRYTKNFVYGEHKATYTDADNDSHCYAVLLEDDTSGFMVKYFANSFGLMQYVSSVVPCITCYDGSNCPNTSAYLLDGVNAYAPRLDSAVQMQSVNSPFSRGAFLPLLDTMSCYDAGHRMELNFLAHSLSQNFANRCNTLPTISAANAAKLVDVTAGGAYFIVNHFLKTPYPGKGLYRLRIGTGNELAVGKFNMATSTQLIAANSYTMLAQNGTAGPVGAATQDDVATFVKNQNLYVDSRSNTFKNIDMAADYPKALNADNYLSEEKLAFSAVWKDDSFGCDFQIDLGGGDYASPISQCLTGPRYSTMIGSAGLYNPIYSAAAADVLNNEGFVWLTFTESPGLYPIGMMLHASDDGGAAMQTNRYRGVPSAKRSFMYSEAGAPIANTPQHLLTNDSYATDDFESYYNEVPMTALWMDNCQKQYTGNCSTWGCWSDNLFSAHDNRQNYATEQEMSRSAWISSHMFKGTVGCGIGYYMPSNADAADTDWGILQYFAVRQDNTQIHYRGSNLLGGPNRIHYGAAARNIAIHPCTQANITSNTYEEAITNPTWQYNEGNWAITHPLNILSCPDEGTTGFGNYQGLHNQMYRVPAEKLATFKQPAGPFIETTWMPPAVNVVSLPNANSMTGIISIENYETWQDSVSQRKTIDKTLIDLAIADFDTPDNFDQVGNMLMSVYSIVGSAEFKAQRLRYYKLYLNSISNGACALGKGFSKLHFRFVLNDSFVLPLSLIQDYSIDLRFSRNTLQYDERRPGHECGERRLQQLDT